MKSLDNEKYVAESFVIGSNFEMEGKVWTIMNSGKPRTQGGSGEPKTDTYVAIKSENETREYKISIKRSDYNFVENKLSMKRIAEIMGEDTAKKVIEEGIANLVKNNAESLYDDMVVKENVVRAKGEEPTTRFKLGWRLDMTNKENGKRSFLFPLTNKQKKEMFTGECLEERKRNAVVNGVVIKDSGVANYLLEMDLECVVNPIDIIEKCVPITEDFVKENNFEIYGTIKAVNYFTNGKYEHARPLVMYVDYEKMQDGTYKPMMGFDKETTLKMNSTDRAKVIEEMIRK